MGIYGVGIDLVKVERIQKNLDRWGRRFTERVFTEKEQRDCGGRKQQAFCFAVRFAAKEAFVKAIGLGLRSPFRWRDVEVRGNALGKPEIFLSERALGYCRERGVRSWHLSLTDDGEYGAAVVVVEC